MDQSRAQQSLVSVVSKMKIFQGLNLSQTSRLLKSCSSRVYQQAETVYQQGENSRELFILIQGKLKVITGDGIDLADILPGTCCGEMGVFTGRPRSATIVAVEKSVGFALATQDMRGIFHHHPEIQIKIQQNVIDILKPLEKGS